MRTESRAPLALAAVVLLAVLAGVAVQTSRPAAGVAVEPVVWQLDVDYPGQGDAGLPIKTIYIKTHDGSDWMSTYDDHPNAVSGPDSIRSLITTYASQGIEVAAWFVPVGDDYDRQVQMALEVIDTGVTALYADLEPFRGFCYLSCHELAENFWYRVREERPNARLGVIYDPRPWWWEQSATAKWLSVADAALPMCYWESYAGQGVWGQPADCVAQARFDLATLAPGRDLDYVPMLQGNTTGQRFQAALDAAVVAGSERVSVWRRGVISQEVWDVIANYSPPTGPVCEETPVDGCLVREASTATVYLIQGGAAFPVGSLEAFDDMGLNWRDVQVVPLGFVESLSPLPADGTLLREFGAAETWLVAAGARFPVADLAELQPLGLDASLVRVTPPGSLARLPLVPADYARVVELGSAQEYLVIGGVRIPVDDTMRVALGGIGHGGPAVVLPRGALAQIAIGRPARGDVDCSGAVAVSDALSMLSVSSRLSPAQVCAHLTGDTDCSGTQDVLDALAVLRFLAEDLNPQPASCSPIGQPMPLPAESPAPPGSGPASGA